MIVQEICKRQAFLWAIYLLDQLHGWDKFKQVLGYHNTLHLRKVIKIHRCLLKYIELTGSLDVGLVKISLELIRKDMFEWVTLVLKHIAGAEELEKEIKIGDEIRILYQLSCNCPMYPRQLIFLPFSHWTGDTDSSVSYRGTLPMFVKYRYSKNNYDEEFHLEKKKCKVLQEVQSIYYLHSSYLSNLIYLL